MARGLTYADAAVLLGGGPQSKIVKALDRLTGGVLLAAAAAGSGFALGLFDAKSELFRQSGELLTGLSEKLRGASRITRTDRLTAAHTVIVTTALFEAMREVNVPFDLDEAEFTATEQLALGPGGLTNGKSLSIRLVRARVPMPHPHLAYEDVLADLRSLFRLQTSEVIAFLEGLATWERLAETDRSRTAERLSTEVPERALRVYEESFRRLAGEFPEFAFWANLVDHQATRTEIRELRTALAGLAADLATITTGPEPAPTRAELSRAHQAVLRRPALHTGQPTGALTIPAIIDSYINPDFRVAADQSAIANHTWWQDQDRRSDLQRFLAGHLTNPAAQTAPLLVLGQPGSGKSLLTQVLAARLPPEDFLTVRVPLREVTADADLQTQIEQAVKAATGEHTTWPRLVRNADGALPVVLLDGFDELLQATGMSQSNFLEKVANFQQREADQQRPVAVVVTSRISVADRARPVDGMTTVLLEPFDDEQITRWLRIWNDTNAARGMTPLPPETALAHRDLAEQPLLLLMLAIYDADGNPLQREESALNQAELYERLLTAFARREVRKSGPDLQDEQMDQAIEDELLALSVVAFAMFNRQQQWVSEPDLDADLAALLPTDGPAGGATEPFAVLTAAQVVVGRFYVHVAQAMRDESRLRTYEFLHATFGEYLIARLVVTELKELITSTSNRGRPRAVDDSFLHALLSFTPLTTRATVPSFINDLMKELPDEDRKRITSLVLGLFHVALKPRRHATLEAYQPMDASVPLRHAAYSANLCLLGVLAAGEITSAQLFPDRADHAESWTGIARLWQSQLPTEDWTSLVHEMPVTRYWSGDNRMLRLSFRSVHLRSDPLWNAGIRPTDPVLDYNHAIWLQDPVLLTRVEASFVCGPREDLLLHTLEPFFGDFDAALTEFHTIKGKEPTSPVRALLTLWMRTGGQAEPDLVADAADSCLRIADHLVGPSDPENYGRIVIRQLVRCLDLLPSEWPERLAEEITQADFEPQEMERLLDTVEQQRARTLDTGPGSADV